jgi:hypothetical protein
MISAQPTINKKVVHAAGAKTPDYGSESFLRNLIEHAGMTPGRVKANYQRRKRGSFHEARLYQLFEQLSILLSYDGKSPIAGVDIVPVIRRTQSYDTKGHADVSPISAAACPAIQGALCCCLIFVSVPIGYVRSVILISRIPLRN